MSRLAQIESRIVSLGELQDIFAAMRSLAGMRLIEAQRALPAIRRYADDLAGSVGAALQFSRKTESREARPAVGRRALVVCLAEHGFVGGFNDRVLAEAERLREPRDLIFVTGSRGAALTVEKSWQPAWTGPAATRASAAPGLVRRLAEELFVRIARGEIVRAGAVFGRYRQGGPIEVSFRHLLPLDPDLFDASGTRLPPLHSLPPASMMESLLAQYASAILAEAAIEALASENAARFSAMEAAHDAITKKIDGLRQSARLTRQDEITTELLDLVTGAEAVKPVRDAKGTSDGRFRS